MIRTENYLQIKKSLGENITLIAVSKTKPIEDIKALYDLGQRDFGENYVQELVQKQPLLPNDIRWHFIGHLQSNKVKMIAPFVHLIHSVDSYKLLVEINKQAKKINRTIDCLLQLYIAQEETKFGLDDDEVKDAMEKSKQLNNISIKGLMAMASFTNNEEQLKKEFSYCQKIFNQLKTNNHKLSTLSMGMSSDYKLAIAFGSNMIRVGSLIFGERNYNL